MTLHVHRCCSQHGKSDSSNLIGSGNDMNLAGSHQISIAKYTVLLSLFFLGKLLCDL
jgi:hypothetical protein